MLLSVRFKGAEQGWEGGLKLDLSCLVIGWGGTFEVRPLIPLQHTNHLDTVPFTNGHKEKQFYY